jgi:hypothetical protein
MLFEWLKKAAGQWVEILERVRPSRA